MAFWQGRSVFVTGATGLLGGWLVPALVRRGANLVALKRDGAPRNLTLQHGRPDQVPTVCGTVTDSDLMRRIIVDYSVETIFHLAAQPLVCVAAQDPAGTLDVNVRGTWTILEASRLTRQCQVLIASSAKAYGENKKLPYKEHFPLRGRYPYDVSKSCVDLISAMYANACGQPVGIVRCGNLFGGGDVNFSRSIPGVICSTLHGEPFVIRGDGKTVRDFLYVEDAVDAYLLLAERLALDKTLNGEAFNFGLEQRLTVVEIVEMVLRLMGRTDLRPAILGGASKEIREQYSSAEKAKRVLNWSPRFGLEDGLRHSIAWYRDYAASLDGKQACPAAAI